MVKLSAILFLGIVKIIESKNKRKIKPFWKILQKVIFIAYFNDKDYQNHAEFYGK